MEMYHECEPQARICDGCDAQRERWRCIMDANPRTACVMNVMHSASGRRCIMDANPGPAGVREVLHKVYLQSAVLHTHFASRIEPPKRAWFWFDHPVTLRARLGLSNARLDRTIRTGAHLLLWSLVIVPVVPGTPLPSHRLSVRSPKCACTN
jgi:hypothetical protein